MYSVNPVVTYAHGYEGGLVEEMTMILLTLPHCRQMHVTRILLGLQKRNKDFRTLHEQTNKMVHRLIDLSLPSLSNGLIKTCIFFPANVFYNFVLDFVFLKMHACANKSGFR